MKACFQPHSLHFKKPGGTSRGVLYTKETYFLLLEDQGVTGIGECAVFRGLSVDDRPDYEEKLSWLCAHINQPPASLLEALVEFPSIQFGLEQALRSLKADSPYLLFPSTFTRSEASIPINGLIWMGSPDTMKKQVEEKLAQGFRTLKMKIGALDFETELALLKTIRQRYASENLVLRVDANGAFHPDKALQKLYQLAEFDVHSIEQPLASGQHDALAPLCEQSPVPIALDEELIGVLDPAEKKKLLAVIKPHYLVLKPSLIGGFCGTNEWISLAVSEGIGWWITSALESNIGLNAIAQFTHTLGNPMPQGLGTGALFTNNIDSPLKVNNGFLQYDKNIPWKFNPSTP